jgi:hypothetical protein
MRARTRGLLWNCSRSDLIFRPQVVRVGIWNELNTKIFRDQVATLKALLIREGVSIPIPKNLLDDMSDLAAVEIDDADIPGLIITTNDKFGDVLGPEHNSKYHHIHFQHALPSIELARKKRTNGFRCAKCGTDFIRENMGQ